MTKTPPSQSEIEVTVFGPGYGESILVHIGDNSWILVDSCIDPETKLPYAISYLNSLGLEPQNVIKYVVATHWHDDHIKGLSYIIDLCPDAEFITSSAIQSDEFLSLIYLYSERTLMEESGIDEFCKIIEILKASGRSIKLAIADRPLISVEGDNTSFGLDCDVHSLSPSDHAVILAMQDIARLIPKVKTTKGRISDLNPNHTSIVLLILIDDIGILLGSDLEETGNVETGWTKIIGSTTRPKKKSCLFKIPHHGSENGDHDDIWIELIDGDFNAVLTPFRKGRVKLPKKSDLERIRCRIGGNSAYITASPKWKTIKKNDKAVQRTINESDILVKELDKTGGFVTFRINISETSKEWNTLLFGNASQI